MATPRNGPYIWVTWLTKILSGDQHCEWSSWFKAHFRDYEKRPRDTDLTLWTARHAEMVSKRAAELRQAGYTVYVEDQNKFILKGRSGVTLGGTPDIVAILENTDRSGPGPHPPYDLLVVDCKSGKPRDSDQFQVLIYMMVLPLTHDACKGKAVRGELEYLDDRIEIDVLPKKIQDLIVRTIERIGSDTPAPLVPSIRECRLCDLTKTDCKQRVDKETPVTASELF